MIYSCENLGDGRDVILGTCLVVGVLCVVIEVGVWLLLWSLNLRHAFGMMAAQLSMSQQKGSRLVVVEISCPKI